ncbi:MAG: PQQ-binding-like beta-propeller repeat protein [Verrucomicrobiales bacterium]|nr:PQQ-binding-like beta-propeller repeat protein [Verrucomicrobiales bacterium]
MVPTARSPEAAGWNVLLLDQIGGSAFCLAASSNRACLGIGPRLLVVDVSQPGVPALRGRTAPVQGIATGVAMSGNHAYVALDAAGLRVMDLSDPDNPRQVGSHDLPGARAVALSGAYVGVAHGGGFDVIDGSDPTQPRRVGGCSYPGDAEGLAMADGFAYVADGDHGLRVIDLSDPKLPRLVGSLDTAARAFGVAVREGYAYVAAAEGGLRVMDVSQPAAPREVGYYRPGGAVVGVAIQGGHAYVANTESGLHVLSLSDPARPVRVGALTMSCSSVAVQQDRLYCLSSSHGLFREVSVANPARPTLAATQPVRPSAVSLDGVAAEGNLVVLGSWGSGFDAVDATDPKRLRVTGSIIGGDSGWFRRVTVSGNYVYGACGWGGLGVVDLSDPAHPRGLVQRALVPAGHGDDVAVLGQYAYLAAAETGLRILDITRPSAPREVGSCDTPGWATAVRVAGDYAYVADSGSGLRIINVRDPSRPVEVGAYRTSGQALDVAVDAGYAYVGDTSLGLRIVNVTDPTKPVLTGACALPGPVVGVAVNPPYVFVAADYAGLRVVDVSRPAAPKEAGYHDLAGWAHDVAVVGDVAFVANMFGGLYALRFGSPRPPVVTTEPQDVEAPTGAEVAFSVVADGAAPLGYQWYKDGTPLSAGGRASGVRTARLSIVSVVASDAGLYHVAVTNAVGSVVSRSARLTVSAVDGGQRWGFLTGAEIFSSPAIGPDGTIYFGSNDHFVYAVDGGTGVKRWSFETGGWVRSSPAVGSDGTVFVGSDDPYVYALEGVTGALRWATLLGAAAGLSMRDSSPAVGFDGTVYIGDGEQNLVALNGATGAVQWTLPIGWNRSCPAIGADGTVFVGSGEGWLYAVDGATGVVKWRFQAGGDVRSSPAVGGNGMIYVGSYDQRVHAVDAATGVGLWSFLTGREVCSSPAVGVDGTVYVGSHDGNVYALDGRTGLKRWQYAMGDRVFGSPAIGADGRVYIGSHLGNVVALDGATGTREWTYQTGGDAVSSPNIGADGTVYIGSYDRILHALTSSSVGGLADSPWPKFRGDASNTGRVRALPASKAVQWSVNGHWYERVDAGQLSWTAARAAAEQRTHEGMRGHLVTVSSAEENRFLTEHPGLGAAEADRLNRYWMGGHLGEGAAEPEEGWAWITGEPFVFENWSQGEPNDWPPGEDHLLFNHRFSDHGKQWNDAPEDYSMSLGYIVEYEPASGEPAEIVESPPDQTVAVGGTLALAVTARGTVPLFYQWHKEQVALSESPRVRGVTTAGLEITNVVLTDAGAYTVSVRNELGATTSQVARVTVRGADGVVLWPVNGHGYLRVEDSGISWDEARRAAETLGGHLVTISTAAENAFVAGLLQGAPPGEWGYWLGGSQEPAADGDPTKGWNWLNREGPFPGVNGGTPYANWHADEPNGPTTEVQRLTLGRFRESGRPDTWNDESMAFMVDGYLVEFEPTLTVPGSANPWLAGMPDGTIATGGSTAPSDIAPAQAPVLFAPVQPGAILRFEVDGSVNHYNAAPTASPDGDVDYGLWTHIPEHGVAGFEARLDALVGVFLDANRPDLTPAPEAFGLEPDAPTSSPGLKQVFFIGDGRTAGGVRQGFVVPLGATRLFLGSMDAWQWNDNQGQFNVRITVESGPVPPPIHYVTNFVWVETVAGSGVAGWGDGVGTQAQFNRPNGGAVDAAGFVYVADTMGHRIRKISPGGEVSTLAGSGVAGHADGPGATAQFDQPLGVGVDGAGTVYVVEAGSHCVRKITAAGVVSTLAGNLSAGYRDGAGATAQFNFPNDVVVDGAGDLYVTEFDNHTVRRVTAAGVVSTWVGDRTAGYRDGPRGQARLTQPGGIAVDGAGNLYVSEWGGQRVRKVSVDGMVSTVAGTGEAGHRDGAGSQAQFNQPDGMAVDGEGNVWVTDYGNQVIRRIGVGGKVETVAGTGVAGHVDGEGKQARFYSPAGIVRVGSGQVVVADWGNHVVRRVSLVRPVAIVREPQSREVWLGEEVRFGVVAAGSEPMSYRWYKDGVVLGEGLRIEGVEGPELRLRLAQAEDAGRYWAVVGNPAGSVASAAAILTVREPEPGQAVWTYTVDGEVRGCPALGWDGTLYVTYSAEGEEAGGIVAMDGVSAERKWSFTDGGRMTAGAAVGPEGTVYVESEAGYLHALDGASGAEKWKVARTGPAGLPAIADDGTVVARTVDGLVALDGGTGTERWRFAFAAGSESLPVIAPNGRVYVGSALEGVWAVELGTGTFQWQQPLPRGGVFAPLAIGPDATLYASATTNEVYALDGSAGSPRWQFRQGYFGLTSAVVGADGTVYVASRSALPAAVQVQALDSRTGALQWVFAEPEGTGAFTPALAEDGTLYVGTGQRLYALDAGTGARKRWFGVEQGISSAPTLDDVGWVYVAGGKTVYAFWGGSGLAYAPWPKDRGDAQNSGRYSCRAERAVILRQPRVRVLAEGEPGKIEVRLRANASLALQWYRGGEPLAAATNATLPFARVSRSDEGVYELRASNVLCEVRSETIVAIPSNLVPLRFPAWRWAGSGAEVEVQSARAVTEPWTAMGRYPAGTTSGLYVETNLVEAARYYRLSGEGAARFTATGLVAGWWYEAAAGSRHRIEYVWSGSGWTNWVALPELTLPASPYLFLDLDSLDHREAVYRTTEVP